MVESKQETHVIRGVAHEVVRLSPSTRTFGAPPIILLHEGLGSVSMWKAFPQMLASRIGCEVIVYSRGGYGKSEPISLPRAVGYMHKEGLDLLPELIDSLDVSRPVLLGHSDGGSIALICAGGSDVALSGLIVMAPHIFVEPITVESIAKAKEAWQSTDLRDRLGRYHDDVDSVFTGWNDIWLHGDFLHWNIEEYLPKIDIPVLAMQGEDDEYGTMAQIHGIAQVVADTELLELKQCRHSPHRDQPETVLDAIDRFINEKVTARWFSKRKR
jgi:pimeloyl-ACP methyl ester carboxylesterase